MSTREVDGRCCTECYKQEADNASNCVRDIRPFCSLHFWFSIHILWKIFKTAKSGCNPSLVWAPVTHFFVSFTLMHSMPLDAAGQRNFTIFVPCQVAKDLWELQIYILGKLLTSHWSMCKFITFTPVLNFTKWSLHIKSDPIRVWDIHLAFPSYGWLPHWLT